MRKDDPTVNQQPHDPAFAHDVKEGLTGPKKRIPPKWLYDERGSKLFEQITDLPEYYLTEAERSIFQDHALDIVDACPTPLGLVELGAGSADKTRLLIEAILKRQGNATFAPVDISQEALQMAKARFNGDEQVTVKPLQGTFLDGLRTSATAGDPPRLIAFIGSSIGNMPLPAQQDLLASIQATMRPHDRFLLGTDLAKDEASLLAAYDDSKGITAAFTLNLLRRINRELGGTFDLDAFEHQATFNEGESAIQIHAESLQDQTVTIHEIDLTVRFQAGERIHIEDSYKYTPSMLERLFDEGGLTPLGTFHDDEERFAVHLLEPANP